MENPTVTDAELRQIAELSMDNKQDEAGAMLAEIGTRAEDEFRLTIRKEIRSAMEAMDAEYKRRITPFAIIVGLLAGLMVGTLTICCLIYYLGVVVSIPTGAALAFICAAIGAFVGWSKAN